MRYPKLQLILGGSLRYIRVNHLSNFLLTKILQARAYPSVTSNNRFTVRRLPDEMLEMLKYIASKRRSTSFWKPKSVKTQVRGIKL